MHTKSKLQRQDQVRVKQHYFRKPWRFRASWRFRKPWRRSTTIASDRPLIKSVEIVTQFYPPDYAATGQLIEELAIQLGDKNTQVQVFTSQPSYAFDCRTAPRSEQCGTRLLVRRSRATRLWSQRIRGKTLGGLFFFLRAALHLLRTRHRQRVLMLTTAPPFLPILGYLINLICGQPYVCLIYDLYPDIATELNVIAANHWLTKFWNWLNCCTWQRAQAVIVLSRTMKDRVLARCPQVADRVRVIHNWANPEHIKPILKSDNGFARQHNLVDRFTVLYSGNMGRCHDLETLLNAVQHLRHDPIQFVFIGDGVQRQDLMERFTQLSIQNVLFLPYQSRDVLPFSLTACDLSLVSICPGMEGLVAPSKLYSALSAGRPIAVICEPHSYLNDIIAAAQCGATFVSGDDIGLANFIRQLSQNPELASTLGQNGRRYSLLHFTPQVIAEQYHHVLTSHTQTALR